MAINIYKTKLVHWKSISTNRQ